MLEKMCAVAYYRCRRWYTSSTLYTSPKKSSTNQQQSVFASTYNSTTTLTPPNYPPYPTEKDRLLDPLTRIHHTLSVPLLYSGSGSVTGDAGDEVVDGDEVADEEERVLELSIIQRYVIAYVYGYKYVHYCYIQVRYLYTCVIYI